MRSRLKKAGCYIIIIVLLPYIVTVFLSGPLVETGAPAADALTVKAVKGEEEATLPLSDYCIGRMAREIPADYEEEALQCQAVLVRTSVCRAMGEGGSQVTLEDEYWTEEEMRREWGGRYGRYRRKMEAAWEDTEGQVIVYGDSPANTPFTRLTNGSTRDGKEVLGSEDFPYLKIRNCPLDIESEEQLQTVVLDDMDAEVTASDTAGYVTQVRVGQETVNGEAFRQTYGLASSCFILQKYEGKLRVTTRGVGHGLGLSQYTANEMAKEGKEAAQILQYFFEGTQIREVAQIVTNSGAAE